MRKNRSVTRIINGTATSDGDGVQLTRIIGTSDLDMLDPFLMLDAFGSDKPLDYIGGFPSHPHRGFETVTYMLAGKMRHKDSAGNQGVIEPGGIQWMTAGKGIIHSEMPEQEKGLLSGLQLWVNLPASKKMTEPKYQEYDEETIPTESINEGITIHVIAGTTLHGTKGIIENEVIMPTYWDVKIDARREFNQVLPKQHTAFIYVIRGEISVGDDKKVISNGQLGILSGGSHVHLIANKKSQFVVIAGKPINEPVAKGGPFVMNTQQEIHQAFADYRSGNFAE
ncbi:MAG: pirin family protein [Marinicellaceae bacterium]